MKPPTRCESESDSSSEDGSIAPVSRIGEKPDLRSVTEDSKWAEDWDVDNLSEGEVDKLLEEFGIAKDEPRETRTEIFGPTERTEPATQPALAPPPALTGDEQHESRNESGILTEGTTLKAESTQGWDEREESQERDTPTPENLPVLERPNALELDIRNAKTKLFQNPLEEFSLRTITLADVPVQVEAMRRATMEELKSMYLYMTRIKPKKVAHAMLYQNTRQAYIKWAAKKIGVD